MSEIFFQWKYNFCVDEQCRSNNDYWYLSPLRDEKDTSFKVNTKLNVWYDHGLGLGGSLLDLAELYHNCSQSEFVKKINENFSFHQPKQTVQQPHLNKQNL